MFVPPPAKSVKVAPRTARAFVIRATPSSHRNSALIVFMAGERALEEWALQRHLATFSVSGTQIHGAQSGRTDHVRRTGDAGQRRRARHSLPISRRRAS